MTNCEKCIHHGICDENRERNHRISNSVCKHFKDKYLIAELPCKIGDKLYFVPDAGYILTCTVAAIHISDEKSVRKKLHKSHIIAISHLSGFGIKFNFDNFGKIVFRTREEAKATMKWSENNDT